MAFDLKAFMDEYAPNVDEPITAQLPGGPTFTFRKFARLSDRESYSEQAIQWFKSLPERGSKKAESHAWKDHLPVDAREAVSAYLLSEMSIEPKLSQLDALTMMAAPEAVKFLLDAIDDGNGSMYSRQIAIVNAQEKGSAATTSADRPSGSPPESGAVIPTNSTTDGKPNSGSTSRSTGSIKRTGRN